MNTHYSQSKKVVPITSSLLNIYQNLAQAYEAEFSPLTHKMPNENGLFECDTWPVDPYIGYLLYFNNLPIGFVLADIKSDIKDVSEFYIIPMMRKMKLGYFLAKALFDQHPGQWQIRQIKGASEATLFWRSVIERYTSLPYEELLEEDARWGMVTKQRFYTGSKE